MKENMEKDQLFCADGATCYHRCKLTEESPCFRQWAQTVPLDSINFDENWEPKLVSWPGDKKNVVDYDWKPIREFY